VTNNNSTCSFLRTYSCFSATFLFGRCRHRYHRLFRNILVRLVSPPIVLPFSTSSDWLVAIPVTDFSATFLFGWCRHQLFYSFPRLPTGWWQYQLQTFPQHSCSVGVVTNSSTLFHVSRPAGGDTSYRLFATFLFGWCRHQL
jgi:hypothetical protein